MSVQYSNPRNRRSKHSTYSRHSGSFSTLPESIGHTEKAIAWLSKVDEFEVKQRRNVFPRWSILVVVLALLAI